MKKILKQTFALTIIAILAIGISVNYAATWTGPTETPPNGNIEAPINTGNNTQAKLGSLILNSNTPIQNSIGFTVFGTSIFNGDIQIATGSPESGKVLTAVDSAGTVTWATNGNGNNGTSNMAFGVWNDRDNNNTADSAVAFNTVYRAETDGIVTAHIEYGGSWPKIYCYTGATTADMLVVSENPDDDGGSSSITCPIRKGDYWKITQTGNISSGYANWLPIKNVSTPSSNCQIRKGTFPNIAANTEYTVNFSSPFTTGIVPVVIATSNITNLSTAVAPIISVYDITNSSFKVRATSGANVNYIAISNNCAEL